MARESPTLATWISLPENKTDIEVVPLIESSNEASCIWQQTIAQLSLRSLFVSTIKQTSVFVWTCACVKADWILIFSDMHFSIFRGSYPGKEKLQIQTFFHCELTHLFSRKLGANIAKLSMSIKHSKKSLGSIIFESSLAVVTILIGFSSRYRINSRYNVNRVPEPLTFRIVSSFRVERITNAVVPDRHGLCSTGCIVPIWCEELSKSFLWRAWYIGVYAAVWACSAAIIEMRWSLMYYIVVLIRLACVGRGRVLQWQRKWSSQLIWWIHRIRCRRGGFCGATIPHSDCTYSTAIYWLQNSLALGKTRRIRLFLCLGKYTQRVLN